MHANNKMNAVSAGVHGLAGCVLLNFRVRLVIIKRISANFACDNKARENSLMDKEFLHKYKMHKNFTSIVGNGSNILKKIIGPRLIPKTEILINFTNYLYKYIKIIKG